MAAETEAIAEEAVGLIDVEYEELPAVFDVADALAPGARSGRRRGIGYSSTFHVGLPCSSL